MGENRCTDGCGLFTSWNDLRGRTEYGQRYYECRWCRNAKSVEESKAARQAFKKEK